MWGEDSVRKHPIAIWLKVLGVDEKSAKPHMVFLCGKKVDEKRARKFFKQDWVRNECLGDPSRDRPGPEFDVVIAAMGQDLSLLDPPSNTQTSRTKAC